MAFHRLSDFVSHVEKQGDLLRIRAEVDPVLEITEIVDRTIKRKGPALLFENVRGSKFPLLVNVLGAERRVEWALGRSPEKVGEELSHIADAVMPPSPKKLFQNRGPLLRVLSMRLRKQGSPPVMNHTIEPADLEKLPVAQSWPSDGGKFITFPLVVTKSPVDGRQNMGVYRMHVYSKSETGMHWQIGKGGGYHYQQAEAKGQPLPLTVVLGADPLLMMCGVLPLPEGMDEMSFAGFLRGEPTRVTQSNGGLLVPAEAEFLLEGFVPPKERRIEGPYGDHFGHYSHAADFPVFHIERIRHRSNAIFPIAVVGKPPQEDQVIGDAVQSMLLPLLKIMHPEVVDLWAYQEAGFHNLIVASVKQRFQKEAVKTGLWILGEGQLALSKVVVLVDPDVNARDFSAVLRAILRNFDPAEDFILLAATSQDTLDFTSFKMNLGSKMIIDATSKSSEKPNDVAGARIELSDLKKVDSTVDGCAVLEGAMLVIRTSGDGRAVLEKMLSLESLRTFKIIVAVSSDIPLDNPVLLLWGLFTRFDCARDTFFAEATLRRGHPVYKGPFFIDATWKPGYPEPLSMTEQVIKKVDDRWTEYGFKD